MKVWEYRTLEALPGGARELLDSAGDGNLFSSVQWYGNFVATVVGASEEMLFLTAGENETRPVAVLPLLRRRDARSGWSPRVLNSLTNYYGCLFELVTVAEEPEGRAGIEAIVKHLATTIADWDTVDLVPLDPADWRFDAIATAFRRHRTVVLKYFAFGNWFLDCDGESFASYFASRGSSTRNRVRSKRKQLEKEHALEIAVVEGGERVDEAIRHYNAVYAVSWKQPEPYPEFMPGLIAAAAGAGWLRLGFILVDERPVAAQVWFVHGRKAYIYKLAYDPEYSEYQVGTLLTMALFEHVLDVDKVREVDFLSGDDEYKSRWMSGRRERHGLEIVRYDSWRGLMLLARRTAGRIRRGVAAMRRQDRAS